MSQIFVYFRNFYGQYILSGCANVYIRWVVHSDVNIIPVIIIDSKNLQWSFRQWPECVWLKQHSILQSSNLGKFILYQVLKCKSFDHYPLMSTSLSAKVNAKLHVKMHSIFCLGANFWIFDFFIIYYYISIFSVSSNWCKWLLPKQLISLNSFSFLQTAVVFQIKTSCPLTLILTNGVTFCWKHHLQFYLVKLNMILNPIYILEVPGMQSYRHRSTSLSLYCKC